MYAHIESDLLLKYIATKWINLTATKIYAKPVVSPLAALSVQKKTTIEKNKLTF